MSIANSPSVILSRPCVSDRNASARSDVHFTGRRVCVPRSKRQHMLGVQERLHADAILTSGVMTRKFAGSDLEYCADKVLD